MSKQGFGQTHHYLYQFLSPRLTGTENFLYATTESAAGTVSVATTWPLASAVG